jgi:DNA primase
MTIFEEVKELVDVPTAARYYGVEVHRGNMALCPFHRERNPSCKLYDDHYYCFGCQAHGDVIKLVQEIFGLSPIEAVKQINNDFGLGLDVEKPPDTEAVSRWYREIVERKAEQANIERMYDILLRYYTLLDR